MELDETEAPVKPCADCAAVSQRQMQIAGAAGVALGVGLFYLWARYAK